MRISDWSSDVCSSDLKKWIMRGRRMDQSLDFALGENADMIRETTARFAADRIAPWAAQIDAEDWFPRDLGPEMGQLGLHGFTVVQDWGGLGLGYLEHVWAVGEVSVGFSAVGLPF